MRVHVDVCVCVCVYISISFYQKKQTCLIEQHGVASPIAAHTKSCRGLYVYSTVILKNYGHMAS
jgi:hypothetical protein